MSISKIGIGHDLRLWPMLSLLLIVVLVPTACLLWFMNRAIENERLAMRKTLEDAYRRDLSDTQTRLEHFWQKRILAIDEAANGRSQPAEVFAHCVRYGLADSVVCYDDQGHLLYPAAPASPPDDIESISPTWLEALRLEYTANDPAAAAMAYSAIIRETDDVNLAALALQAQARCLVQSGDKKAAIQLIAGMMSDKKFDRAIDSQGRLIVPNTQLMALQLMDDPEHPTFNQISEQLQKRLNEYDDPAMSGTQRLFLMQELKRLLGMQAKLPLLAAEELAARFIELNQSSRQDNVLYPSPLPGVWRLDLPNGRLTALWRTDTILSQTDGLIDQSELSSEVSIMLRPPNAEAPAASVFYSLPSGKYLPNWQLTLSWIDGGSTEAASNRRITIYLWTGILVIAAISILAVLMAQTFRNQMRHARLKNDLVATVSHELKTPLSSIRLLVDTLLDNQSPNLKQTREYLQLIAKENMRLSRLIDNFLAFSRMERNKHAFQFSETSPAEIIKGAVDAMQERFDQSGCHLYVDVDDNLPNVTADPDALVTVVINLLDNAYKYTGDKKHIVLRAYAENGNLCIAVTDNGVGLSRTAAKKVFERFYQADRRLSRNAGGCGLGLSIVKFIVAAHGGSVEVDSRPGQGSTFKIILPSPFWERGRG